MRFLMINLFLVFLLFFGIGYLAFGSVEIGANSELPAHHVDNTPWEASFETFRSEINFLLFQK
ncbi:MAG: hypothetical protein OYL97_13635 [Candidatus Poribacteria bacterium]|nr:hypothetical protein [Candidatus Poribacteria bacterium]